MNMSFEKTLGWVAFVAGAIWLISGVWEIFRPNNPGQDNDIFLNIVIPIFAMISAFTLLIRKK